MIFNMTSSTFVQIALSLAGSFSATGGVGCILKKVMGITILLLVLTSPALLNAQPKQSLIQEYSVPAGSRPHDVAPASNGAIWYVAQGSGELGRLDPVTGKVRRVNLGDKSRPHGVIVGT
jgi:virginiamycin B lyase